MSPSAAVDVTAKALGLGLGPTVIMRSAWERVVEAPSEQQERDRLVLVLRSAASALHEAMALPELPDRHRFAVPLANEGAPLAMSLLLDAPVLTIALPDEA